MRIRVIAFVAALLFGACGAPEPLPPKPATVPMGLDLSGQWELRGDSGESRRQIEDSGRRAAGGDDDLLSRSKRNTTQPKSPDIFVHVFIESGRSLKITQTEHGLFVSFDRSVVEEYRFGEQRTTSVGAVEAERVSGWENNAYVIETRDKEGAMLIDTYRLDDPDTLVRTIRIVHRDQNELDITQVFDRV